MLTRWFDADALGERAPAAWLDVILYSRAQLLKERDALPAADKEAVGPLPNAPWGIISVKAQDEAGETPMQPITAMRNALGRDQGGSGVPLDKAKYDEAVEYWRERAAIVRGSPSGE